MNKMPEARIAEKVIRCKKELEAAGFELRMGEMFSIVKNEDCENMIFYNANTIQEVEAFMGGLESAARLTDDDAEKVKNWP